MRKKAWFGVPLTTRVKSPSRNFAHLHDTAVVRSTLENTIFRILLGRDRPVAPETFTFLDRLFGKMATLFPDRHFHEGGDEISGADWKANPRVQEFMKTNGLMRLGGARVLLLRPRAEGRGGSRQDRRVAVPTSLKERRTRSVVELTPSGGAAIPPDPDGPTVRVSSVGSGWTRCTLPPTSRGIRLLPCALKELAMWR